MKRRTRAGLTLLVSLLVIAAVAAGSVRMVRRQKQKTEAARQAQIAEQQRMEAENAARKAAEEAARLEAERIAAEEAARAEAEALEQAKAMAAEAKQQIQVGDCIGTVWVEGTEVNCELYWGDSGREFRLGAGCQTTDGCVKPGENGTVFVGGHTDSWFVDLKSAQLGAIIHLDTLWGSYEYQIVDTKVIYDTDVGACRWGDTEPNCILYTCYPFGIQVPTNQRYLVYANPLETDENGVVASGYPTVQEPS